jgi:hypothetical protein
MKTFAEFIKQKYFEQSTVGTEFVDETQIDSAYQKSKFAVKLVQLYDQMTGQKLLTNISTIATLNQGVYGLYNSAENKKVIGPNISNKVKMIFGDEVVQSNKLDKIPNAVIKQYAPDVDLSQIKPSDVIHINIQKHIAAHGDTLETVLEIASTIVHECTHELELQTTGRTNEVGPVAASHKFLDWTKKNWTTIIERIPALAQLPKKGSEFGV